MPLTLRQLTRLPRISKSSHPSLSHRSQLDEEILSRVQYNLHKLREIPIETSLHKVLIDTPEFSRFIFAVPGTAILGMTVLSLSSPATLPLIFEKFVPYQIKTIGISLCFHSFIDLAVNVIGRPSLTAHHRMHVYSALFLAYASLISVGTLLSVSDTEPRTGFKGCLALLALHAIPGMQLSMPPWLRTWRLGFIGLSTVSVVAAWSKLDYLETHWDSVVFSNA